MKHNKIQLKNLRASSIVFFLRSMSCNTIDLKATDYLKVSASRSSHTWSMTEAIVSFRVVLLIFCDMTHETSPVFAQ